MENDFKIGLVGSLDSSKSKEQINQDIENLKKQLSNVKIKASLDGNTLKNLSSQLDSLQIQLKNITISPQAINKMVSQINSSLGKVNLNNISVGSTSSAQKVGQQIGQQINNGINNGLNNKALKIQDNINLGTYDAKLTQLEEKLRKLGLNESEAKSKIQGVVGALKDLKEGSFDQLISREKSFNDELKRCQNNAVQLKADINGIYNPTKQSSLSNNILNWLAKNTAATKKAKTELQDYYKQLNSGKVSIDNLTRIEQRFKAIDAEQRSMGKLGKTFKDQWAGAIDSFKTWLSASSAVMLLVSNVKNAVSELKEVDTLLTEISKTSDRTKEQLKSLGSESYSRASKFGIKATDWLTGVQEMNRSGFYGEQGNELADTSALAQSAGDMPAEIANNWILATNSAYKYQAQAEKLNAVLDGTNEINTMVSLYGNI